jgi:hypothetical protein
VNTTSRIEKTVFKAMKGDGKVFLDSFKANAMDLNKMNGTTDIMGLPSQGAQELAQKVQQNEKTGIMQRITDFLNRGPFPGSPDDPRTPTGSKLIEGPDGQMYDENFLKTIPGGFNNMQEIQRRKEILEMTPTGNPYRSLS